MTYERELELTADRLRQLSDARLRPQQAAVYAVLAAMTDRAVPVLEPHVWGDQIAVIGREVPEAVRPQVSAQLRELRRRFDLSV